MKSLVAMLFVLGSIMGCRTISQDIQADSSLYAEPIGGNQRLFKLDAADLDRASANRWAVQQDETVIVMFWFANPLECKECAAAKPVYESYLKQNPDLPVKLSYIDAGIEQIADDYMGTHMNVPHFFALKKGKIVGEMIFKEVDFSSAADMKTKIHGFIDNHAKRAAPQATASSASDTAASAGAQTAAERQGDQVQTEAQAAAAAAAAASADTNTNADTNASAEEQNYQPVVPIVAPADKETSCVCRFYEGAQSGRKFCAIYDEKNFKNYAVGYSEDTFPGLKTGGKDTCYYSVCERLHNYIVQYDAFKGKYASACNGAAKNIATGAVMAAITMTPDQVKGNEDKTRAKQAATQAAARSANDVAATKSGSSFSNTNNATSHSMGSDACSSGSCNVGSTQYKGGSSCASCGVNGNCSSCGVNAKIQGYGCPDGGCGRVTGTRGNTVYMDYGRGSCYLRGGPHRASKRWVMGRGRKRAGYYRSSCGSNVPVTKSYRRGSGCSGGSCSIK